MKTLVLQSNPEVPLTLKFFLAAKKVLFVLITLVKKLESHDFSSIFHEFLKFEKYALLWFTAELQGEWAESVCDVSRGSHFAGRDNERENRLQIRGHRGIAQRKKYYSALEVCC